MVAAWLRATLVILLPVVILFFSPLDGLARSSGSHSNVTSISSHRASSSHSIKCESCPRDSKGKIKRDPNAVSEFKRTHPKPSGCHQCEVDHIVPLSKGGRDVPSNMQWLPKEQHQDKTKLDRQRP